MVAFFILVGMVTLVMTVFVVGIEQSIKELYEYHDDRYF